MGGLGDVSAAAPRASTPRVWSFAGCVLDERSLELKVRGQVADLDRKPLEVLIHLLRHAGEVVTKDELAEAVWPGRIITDSNLTKTMAVLRAALGDSEATVIKTVHGYGYRLMAPVSVQAHASGPAPARFDFKPGESPPLRPHWQLSELLGAGSHGEVWLAHHSKTKEPRVFKFAEGGTALTALKREITLNRLLHETLPGRDDYLRLLDWNFDEPPFFVESEYATSGSLAGWAESQGGLAQIPLATRLDLIAQAAEALAAAHSVGVLHKDLKPTNILVVCHSEQREESGPIPRVPRDDKNIRIKLADFGSGGVLDTSALEALGITSMGFTQKVSADDPTSGTPLYLAPEVIAGQPFTVQSDIYALGVMLYQLVAGDTRKALAPGWEKDVADELLHEDIAQAAAGNPADRLSDAALLAQRLRTLDARRQQREDERARQSQAERAQRMRGELKRLRATAAVLLLLTAVATAAGVVAVRSRDEAQRAVETTQAVNQFLNKDLLAKADPRQGATRDMTVRKLLDRASETVAERFRDQPEAAAQVHVTLGEAYWQLDELQLARVHLERAVALLTAIHGPTVLATLEARGQLAGVLNAMGRQQESCAMTREVRAQLERQLDPGDDRRLFMRAASARCLSDFAALDEAIPEISAVVGEFEQRGMTDSDLYISALMNLSMAYFNQMEFVEAEKLHRKLLDVSVRKWGASHFEATLRRAILANTLTLTGRLAEADAELGQAIRDQRNWLGKDPGVGIMTIAQAILRLEQGRFREAEALARECLDSTLGRQKRGTFRLAGLYVLTESLLTQGQVAEAARLAEETVMLNRELGVPKQFHEVSARAHWADALARQNKVDEGWRVLNGLTPEELAAMPERNAFYALFRRSQGLLWMKEGKAEQARAALRESLEIYEFRYGADHWRTQRARAELGAQPFP